MIENPRFPYGGVPPVGQISERLVHHVVGRRRPPRLPEVWYTTFWPSWPAATPCQHPDFNKKSRIHTFTILKFTFWGPGFLQNPFNQQFKIHLRNDVAMQPESIQIRTLKPAYFQWSLWHFLCSSSHLYSFICIGSIDLKYKYCVLMWFLDHLDVYRQKCS